MKRLIPWLTCSLFFLEDLVIGCLEKRRDDLLSSHYDFPQVASGALAGGIDPNNTV
ncbi:hypothetical protein [Ktedonobacter sp. SOSP1-85]|uniref:hypothetical protein n=1 Tax=Ktedonobacter sp. SOSP1-85 TaxID=2778367 RepID=UPI00191584F5|nr:hypothetical protein [Ktedonobacter sp. SOSP1-85]